MFLGSLSIHFRSRQGVDTGDNFDVGVGRGLTRENVTREGVPFTCSQRLQQEFLLTFRLRIC